MSNEEKPKARHRALANIVGAAHLIQGRAGLTREEQLECLAKARRALLTACACLEEASAEVTKKFVVENVDASVTAGLDDIEKFLAETSQGEEPA